MKRENYFNLGDEVEVHEPGKLTPILARVINFPEAEEYVEVGKLQGDFKSYICPWKWLKLIKKCSDTLLRKSEQKQCSCDIQTLMCRGCQCGGV